jgi:LPXTG-motif cell wall-anchored protein
MGFGDFTDESPCASIPAGDPYRKPGNYCATPDGGYTTFNADGSTYSMPTDSGSILDKIGGALTSVLGQKPPVAPAIPMMPQTGMSTTTMVALAGGAVLLVVLLTRR